MTIQAVTEQAVNGRGLWAGVFLAEYPNDTLGRKKHPLRELVGLKPHVTLAHFGRKNDEHTTRMIHDCLTIAANRVDLRELEITGVGLFWRRNEPTHVALVNSAGLCELRADFLRMLRKEGVPYDDRYGFVPHITLDTNGSTFDMLYTRGSSTGLYHDKILENAGAVKVLCTRPKLVCGDAEVTV